MSVCHCHDTGTRPAYEELPGMLTVWIIKTENWHLKACKDDLVLRFSQGSLCRNSGDVLRINTRRATVCA